MMKYFRFILLLLLGLNASAQKLYLFIGTYTDTGSNGIYVYTFDTATGKAEWVSNTTGIINPSYLTVSSNEKFIYAVTETATANPGSISAFAFDRTTGKLTFINKQVSGGANPCYIITDRKDKWVIAGNYTGGSLASFKINSDGSLQPHAQVIQHTGKSINKERQDRPHVHCTVLSPDQKYLLVPDLGLDKVMIYRFKRSAKQALDLSSVSFAASIPGSGPRHITFHPNKKFAYLAEEISGTVVAYKYRKGELSTFQRIATHPDSFAGKPATADIHVSPDGKFLYVSNRGDENNIAIFSIDSKGRLTTVGYESTGGKTPRNFVIDPTGNYLLAANQNTANVVVFKIDRSTGLLTKTGEEIKVPKPVCLKMIE